MRTGSTTSASETFPTADASAAPAALAAPTANPIGPIATPKIGPIETGNPNGIFGPSGSVFGPDGFDGGMSFPGMPDSAASTPGGGYKTNGY